jgi:LAO/AO transport system kinase
MKRHAEDPGVFIRSVASRGHLGGLTDNIHRLVDLMDVSGRDIIIIETVGAGQSEVEIVKVADVCVVVNAPNLDDDVQAIKTGILEIADVLVVNKADLPLASRTADHLRAMLALRAEQRDVPVIETVATSGAGSKRSPPQWTREPAARQRRSEPVAYAVSVASSPKPRAARFGIEF